MKAQSYYRLASIFTVFVLFQFIYVSGINAQDATETKPELSVAGIELGNRDSAESFLKDGYSPRLETDGRVGYYFYNKWANQVMRLSAPSMEDKYFITEIEVFKVNRSYREKHFHNEDIKYFSTESGIFIGFKQSAAFLIAGLENTGKINRFKTKNLVNLKGDPDERNKVSEKEETLTYKVEDVKVADSDKLSEYEASFDFYKNELKRFKLTIVINNAELAKK